MSRTIDYPFEDGTTKKMELRIAQYADNGNLYVGLYGIRSDDVIPLTVNIDKLGYPMSCVDTNNLGQKVVDLLEENKLARFTGHTLESGYCSYPIMAFFPEVLRDIDPKSFAAYRESHGFLPEQELDELRREASARASEKNAERDAAGKARQSPELGL